MPVCSGAWIPKVLHLLEPTAKHRDFVYGGGAWNESRARARVTSHQRRRLLRKKLPDSRSQFSGLGALGVFSLLRSVRSLMPSSLAARVRLPPVAATARSM